MNTIKKAFLCSLLTTALPTQVHSTNRTHEQQQTIRNVSKEIALCHMPLLIGTTLLTAWHNQSSIHTPRSKVLLGFLAAASALDCCYQLFLATAGIIVGIKQENIHEKDIPIYCVTFTGISCACAGVSYRALLAYLQKTV